MTQTGRSLRAFGGAFLVLQIVLVVGVLWLGYYALTNNRTLCAFKRDLQSRRDASAAYLHSIETGARQLPLELTLTDLRSSLAARDATLRSLRDLKCSP